MEKKFSFGKRRLFGILFTFFAVFAVFANPCVYAQDESAVRQDISARIRKLNKADRIKNDADKLSDEATALQASMKSIQRDTALKERVKKRKIGSLETQSWHKEFQASLLYEKTNSRKYVIYKKYLNRFWKEHEGEESKYLNAKVLEEQARDNHSQAKVYRRKTKHMNLGFSKIEKLTEAKNLEAVAIRKQVTSLTSCYEIQGTQAKANVPQNSPKPDTAETAVLKPVINEPVSEPLLIQNTPSLAPAEKKAEKPLNPVTEPRPVITENKAAVLVPEAGQEKTNGVLFRIQVAASRVPLPLSEFVKLNTGKYPVEAVSEGGWLKYQLLGQPMYSEVQRIFREMAISGSFIVAYRNGVKQNPAELIKENRELEKKLVSEGKPALPEYTEYHVELRVSKTALKPDEVARLYHGPEPVTLIMENGSFGYHLNAGNSPELAGKLKQGAGAGNAVIVVYKHSKRVPGN